MLAQLNDWVAKRQWNHFVRGLPALTAGVMLGLAILMIWANHRQSDRLDYQYRHRALVALQAGRFEEARVACLRELSNDLGESDRLQTVYQLALTLSGLGQKREAVALLTHAAPLDRPGSLPAHILLAQMFLNEGLVPDENNLKLAEQHLLSALALDPQSSEVNELLGRYYINTHNLTKARARLMEIYPAKTEAALLLAITYALEKDKDTATLWADTAISDYSLKLKNSAPGDDPTARLGLASALMVEEKYAQAIAALEQGQRLAINPAYALTIADDCATWADRIANTSQKNAAERLRLIQKGLTNSPQNIKLQMQLVQAAREADQAGQAAKTLLNQSMALAKGEAAADWHFLLWTDARERGDLIVARRQLQIAYELAPQVPFIRNDLAMDLSTGNLDDAERGLKIIQSVVEQFPENPQYRDTRGRILARLGRNGEAVADLELAVAKLWNPEETRRVLAKAKTALGKPQLTEAPHQMLKKVKSTQ